MTKERESWEMKRGKVGFGWTPRHLQEQSKGSRNTEQRYYKRQHKYRRCRQDREWKKNNDGSTLDEQR